MPRPRHADRELEALARLRGEPATADTVAGLVRALGSRRAVVVAEAARLAAAGHVEALEEDLILAFERLRDAAPSQDPGALAKTACAQALLDLAAARGAAPGREVAERVLLAGARLRQLDPAFGARVEVAGPLRTLCAAGLLERGDARATAVLVDHLADGEAPVRQAAARHLGARGGTEAASVLRLKVRLGDTEPAVHGDACRALLALDGEEAVPVVAAWLDHADEAVVAEAALALGASRAPTALGALRTAWECDLDPRRRQALLAAIGLVRDEAVVPFLLDLVRDAGPELAAEAVRALGGFVRDPTLRSSVGEAVAGRRERGIREAWEEIVAGERKG